MGIVAPIILCLFSQNLQL